MIRLRRLVLTMRLAVVCGLSHVMPPAGRTFQRSREASCRISEISSVVPGKIVFEEMLAAPTICASKGNGSAWIGSVPQRGSVGSVLRIGPDATALRY